MIINKKIEIVAKLGAGHVWFYELTPSDPSEASEMEH